MKEWKKEICPERPEELQKISDREYVQRKDIRKAETEEGTHYECLCRFIAEDEKNLLEAIGDEVKLRHDTQVIDDYTLTLIEEGVL